MYLRKTKSVWELYVNYGQGWEYEFATDTYAVMKETASNTARIADILSKL